MMIKTEDYATEGVDIQPAETDSLGWAYLWIYEPGTEKAKAVVLTESELTDLIVRASAALGKIRNRLDIAP